MQITAMTLTNGTLTIIVDNGSQILTVQTDHPKWNEILEAFKRQDNATILSLVSLKTVVEKYSVGALSVNSAGVTYNGRLIHTVDTDRIMAFLKEGLPYQPIANYMARKMLNPSARAITEMYSFLEHKFMPLTPEGMIIAYKGVMTNWFSKTGNKETVVIQGVVDDEGRILNTIGSVIEIERSSCDDDFRKGCSFGLHAGSLEYATGWSDRVVLVEIDPKDVVSVPDDCSCQKLRCCKYKVVGEFTGALPSHYTDEFSAKNTESVVENITGPEVDDPYQYDVDYDEDQDCDGCGCDNCQNPDCESDSQVDSSQDKVEAPVTPTQEHKDIETRVFELLKDQFDFADYINSQTLLGEFMMDSLDTVELTMALEEEFRIDISEEDAGNFKNTNTAGDIVEYIRKKTAFVNTIDEFHKEIRKQDLGQDFINLIQNSLIKPDSLEQIAVESGVLTEPNPRTAGYINGFHADYPIYLPGDENGADSDKHRQYILGYLEGYAFNHLPKQEG